MFSPDDIVRASGEGGTFRVIGIRKDGSVDVWGGLGGHGSIKGASHNGVTGHASFRTFLAERLRLAK